MNSMTTQCVYLKEERAGKETKDGRQVYDCEVHEQCTKIGNSFPFASCEECKQKLLYDDDNFSSEFLDPLVMTDRAGEKTHALRNMLAGGISFLVCGGPSAKSLDLNLLNQRGIWSMAVNNMAGYFKPNAFVCSDPPSKFHNGIWQDPSIMKLIPTPKMRSRRGRLRRKVGNEFESLIIDDVRINACDCPNVWGFGRRAWFIPDESFFLENHASWGNHDSGVKRTGENKTVCTLLLAFRLLYTLGSRKIYLVGVDWGMDSSKNLKENYAFGENRDQSAVQSNNNQYSVVGPWLEKMQNEGTFEKFGLEIFNCFEYSRLRSFPYVPFNLAVEDALKDMPEEPYDLESWYFKPKKEKK